MTVDNSIRITERATAPDTPDTGDWRLYAKSDGIYQVDDAGTETNLSSGGGSSTPNFGSESTKTISSGAVATGSDRNLVIAAETGTADDLIEITGLSVGDKVLLRANTGDTITVKHNDAGATVKILVQDDADIVLDEQHPLEFVLVATNELAQVYDEVGSGGIGGSTGGTDNAILRADGTGGSTVQNSSPLIDDSGNITNVNSVRSKAATELTIASGAVTITQDFHTIDTQSDASTDDLDTISGGTAGDSIWISANNAARTVVVKHGTGNIQTWDGNDIDLDETRKMLLLKYDGTNWIVVSVISASGGGGSVSVAVIEHHEAANTHAGATSASTWNTRPITRIASDADSIVTINTTDDDFLPDSGTYLIHIAASIYGSGFSRLRLYNVTQASVELQGVNGRPASDANTDILYGVFSPDGTDEFRVEHYASTAKATDGLGDAANNGSEEIYMQITLIKVA